MISLFFGYDMNLDHDYIPSRKVGQRTDVSANIKHYLLLAVRYTEPMSVGDESVIESHLFYLYPSSLQCASGLHHLYSYIVIRQPYTLKDHDHHT